MFSKRILTLQMCFLLVLPLQLSATKYKFVPENADIFSDCRNQPSNVLNMEDLADTSNTTFELTKDSITISGNATIIWNVRPTDRIQMRFELLRYDRGTWLSTPFAITNQDFCKDMFDKNQYWYMYWTQHITNVAESRNICPLSNPGATIIHEPFDVDVEFDCESLVPFSGRHKAQLIWQAFDQKNVERETKICIDIIGEIIRAN